jgi:tetratricopeptide (TPR) repeat protein
MEKEIKKYMNRYIVFLLLAITGSACKKDQLLNEKPSTKLVVPSTVPDFQAILDGDYIMNVSPVLGELSSDNYYLTYDNFQFGVLFQNNAYTWTPDLFAGAINIEDWNVPYQAANQADLNNLKGEAFFYRANAFFNIAQEFAPMYDSATAATDPGIPLRLTSDINAGSVRATVKQTYDQLIGDLLKAVDLLPAALPMANRNRPSKAAAYALLARVYLSMRAYDKAGPAADGGLQVYNALIDYNTVTASTLPFKNSNAEAIFQSTFVTSVTVTAALIGTAYIDSTLYRSYDANDLRKTIFFTGTPATLRGGYAGSLFTFSGLAVDELYMIRAECAARAGNTLPAMNDVNAVLVKRFKTGTFVALTAANAQNALAQVLIERRKELLMRGVRWTDLRRLNKEGNNITLKRILNGVTYTLAPNSPLYVLPIPPDVIALSGIAQNAR